MISGCLCDRIDLLVVPPATAPGSAGMSMTAAVDAGDTRGRRARSTDLGPEVLVSAAAGPNPGWVPMNGQRGSAEIVELAIPTKGNVAYG